jgi:hypothetical protein
MPLISMNLQKIALLEDSDDTRAVFALASHAAAAHPYEDEGDQEADATQEKGERR